MAQLPQISLSKKTLCQLLSFFLKLCNPNFSFIFLTSYNKIGFLLGSSVENSENYLRCVCVGGAGGGEDRVQLEKELIGN